MKISFDEFARTLRNATENSVALYRSESSYPKPNAQANLSGRTHYVEDSTLKYFGSRVLSSRVLCEGAFFMIVESVATDYNKTRRGFRFVVFDIFGNTIERANLDEAYKTRNQAEKAFSKWYGAFDVESYYTGVLAERSARLSREAAALKTGADILAAAVSN